MLSLRIDEAKTIARGWVQAYMAEHEEVLGAVLNGSVAELPDWASLPETSDVDINLIVREAPAHKPGKFPYHGVLLEVSFLPLSMLQPKESVLTRYEIAGAFRSESQVLGDRDETLGQLAAYAAQRFSQPQWVQARCEAVYRKIEQGAVFSPNSPMLDNINPWLFPCGIMTHAILVAAQRNPTVRLRYLRAREVLEAWQRPDAYETLLSVLGCGAMSASRMLSHLNHLEMTYDLAAANCKSAFPFRNDIHPASRIVAIDGSRALIEAGDHREAAFWIIVTFERCHRILRADAPDLHAQCLPDFMALLSELDADTPQKLAGRIAAVRAHLPWLRELVDAHLEPVAS